MTTETIATAPVVMAIAEMIVEMTAEMDTEDKTGTMDIKEMGAADTALPGG